jgi:hypothetical protein
MTHNATSLILPGGSPITATVGDTFVAISDTNSNVTVYAYQRSGGTTGSHINVRDYGANPAATGTVNAAAIQAAITAAEAIDWTPTGHSLRPVIYIPAGEYKTNEITTTKPVYIKGDGRNATMLRLDTGRTGSLLTLGVIDRGSTSAEDFDHPRVESMCLVGNRVDSTTTGTSHGIHCPDPGWTTATQYSPSFTGVDLMIEGFTGNGIAAYVNRNLMMLERVICRYNNDNGLYLNDNFDSLISSCEFGNNKNFGIFEDNALNVKVTLCDIYYNDYNVKRLNCSGVSMYIGCTIQAAAKDGFWQAGGYGPIISSCMFLDNSRDTNNTYSNIAFTGSIEVCSVVGCYFQWTTGNRVKYLVSGLSGVTQVAWAGNSFSSVNLAYATGTFDQPFKIAVAGDVSGFTVHSTGADQLLYSKASGLIDGISTPTTVSGVAFIFVDSADGDLKIKYGDGTVKLIVVDT